MRGGAGGCASPPAARRRTTTGAQGTASSIQDDEVRMKPGSVSLIAAAALAVAVGVGMVLARQRDGKSAGRPMGPTSAADAAGRKQLWHCGMHPQVVQDHPGECPICHMALTPLTVGGGAQSTARKVLYWWDPMLGPSSISDRPGKSAMGMDLIP